MYSKLRLSVIILGLTAAGCAGDPSGVLVTGRDWNCPRCYK